MADQRGNEAYGTPRFGIIVVEGDWVESDPQIGLPSRHAQSVLSAIGSAANQWIREWCDGVASDPPIGTAMRSG